MFFLFTQSKIEHFNAYKISKWSDLHYKICSMNNKISVLTGTDVFWIDWISLKIAKEVTIKGSNLKFFGLEASVHANHWGGLQLFFGMNKI